MSPGAEGSSTRASFSIGLGTDYIFTPSLKLTAAFDFYAISFPNYSSLESKVGTNLGREQAQVHTLDTTNYSWTFAGSSPSLRGRLRDLTFT